MTILEVLDNAEYNLSSKNSIISEMGKQQLSNALYLIHEHNFGLDDEFNYELIILKNEKEIEKKS